MFENLASLWPNYRAHGATHLILARVLEHLHRTVELEAVLGRLAHEDFTVENGDRSVREIALDVLVRAGWVPMRPSS
jgi:hypothetical protein